ncbi:NAD(P)/FAD-dependent oxidoreductase [Lacrimispora sp.]|uniref:NAD(P)/FAD-dependent oxidoreductase n=1 Tax=Lacrimispora sp. TaxID=2719234 RepID=UPI0032E4BBF5
MKQQIIIIGAGASGLAAGISAAREGASVTIMEHTARPGKKLLSTGNGKCNITNLQAPKDAYRGNQPDFVFPALHTVTVSQTMDFFKGLGIVLTERNGYVYPNSGQASTVLEAMLFELEHLGVRIVTECPVKEIKKDLTVITDHGKQRCDRIILAAGSMAAPKTGSDGSGYSLARKLGHHIIEPLPALVQLRCKEKWYKQAAGVRTDALVTLKIDGKTTVSDRGELQITDYGISGIPVFQISRYAARAMNEGRQAAAQLDFLPELSLTDLEKLLFTRHRQFEYRPAEEFLHGVLNSKLAKILLKEAGIGRESWVKEITEKEIKNLVHCIKELKTIIVSTNTFDQAQVCSGGVDTKEVDPVTMESRLTRGLYFSGEILDVDGICGGYNLQWAWSSGITAGIHAGRGEIKYDKN